MRAFHSSILWLAATIFVVMVPVCLWAETESKTPFSTELGFTEVTDQSTPEFLKTVSESVFEIRTFVETSIEDLIVIDMEGSDLDDFQRQVQDSSVVDRTEKVVLNLQIEKCRTSDAQDQCVLRRSLKGTAFLAGGDGSTLWTNAHVVDRFLEFRASYEEVPVREILPTRPLLPVFLFNRDGKLVFNPYDDEANLAYFPRLSPMAVSRSQWYAEDTDFVGIQLSRSVGRPLVISESDRSEGLLYRPGFPACTGCPDEPNFTDPILNNDRSPHQNSNGDSMYWSSGRQLGSEQMYAVVNPFFHSMLEIYWLDQMVFFSADAQVGFSGGPIVNDQGQVLAIYAGSLPRIFGDQMIVMSRGVRPPVFDELVQTKQ